MAATQGHTQSLHTNALDEALALPTDFSARIARNTQLFLQQESGTTANGRPVGRQPLRRAAHPRARRTRRWTHIAEVEEMGGMAAAIEAGIPKMRIEEAAARTQARIDSGSASRSSGSTSTASIPTEGRDRGPQGRQRRGARAQLAKLDQLRRRAGRGRDPCSAALDALTKALRSRRRPGQPARSVDRRGPRQGDGRRDQRRAGEGLRSSHRRPSARSPGCTERSGCRTADSVERCANGRSTPSRPRHGRRPRILIAKMGQDGHDRGQKVIATAFADLGFDVDIGPLFQTPAEARPPGRRG